MPGQWLRTQAENNRTASTTATTQQVVSVDLPRSNFLAAVGFTLRVLGVGTPTLTVDRIRVIANGSLVIWDTRGGESRGIAKFDQGGAPNGLATSTTDLSWRGILRFGRFPRDEAVILPAKIFKSLQLQITYTPGAGTSVTSVSLDAWSDEFVTDADPRGALIKKNTEIAVVASSSSLLTKQRLPLGNLLRSLFLLVDDLDNIGANSSTLGGTNPTANTVRVLVNNGAEIPFSMRADQINDENVATYRFHDNLVPTGEVADAAVFTGTAVLYKIDFDVAEDLKHALDTSRMNELAVEFQAASSGTSGNTSILMEEILAVGA